MAVTERRISFETPFATTNNNVQYNDETFNPTELANKPNKILVRGASTRRNDNDTTKEYNEHASAPLISNASYTGLSPHYQDLEYADPHAPGSKVMPEKTQLSRFLGPSPGKYPLQQRIQDKRRGIGRQKHPFVVYLLAVAMVGYFVYELVLNAQQQGSPLSFKPVVNYMLGPSSSALIHLGSRFPPCMKNVPEIPLSTNMGCMNNTANPITSICTVAELCGFGGVNPESPNQWWRFILPIFIHAGIIHLLLNLVALFFVSGQLEREMGSGGFIITFFAAGIFGNVLGGNFARPGVPSVGASGAIFGCIAVNWVDLFSHWQLHDRPVRKLVFMTIELAIGVAIGYIPYVDNFAHLGGFLMGLLVGTVFYPVIYQTGVNGTQRRRKLIVWGFRLVALPIAIILFVLLTRNFYTSDPSAACEGCRYLSCFPTASNNRCGGTGLTTTTTSS